jgi:catechol 2,3-dioxygenase-like lactoylglutathione lyase family enzyme
VTRPRTGYIDHIGIGVRDLAAARAYYDELMPILGLKQWFKPHASRRRFLADPPASLIHG